MSKDFPVQTIKFATWELKEWKYKAINHKILFKTIFFNIQSTYSTWHFKISANNDAEKIAFLVRLKQDIRTFISSHKI